MSFSVQLTSFANVPVYVIVPPIVSNSGHFISMAVILDYAVLGIFATFRSHRDEHEGSGEMSNTLSHSYGRFEMSRRTCLLSNHPLAARVYFWTVVTAATLESFSCTYLRVYSSIVPRLLMVSNSVLKRWLIELDSVFLLSQAVQRFVADSVWCGFIILVSRLTSSLCVAYTHVKPIMCPV